MIRPFSWRDLPRLHRYRKRGLWLDNETALTQWLFAVPAGAMTAYLAPATGIFSYVSQTGQRGRPPLIGQLYHTMGSEYAKLVFMAPEDQLDSSAAFELLDFLAEQSGRRGAQNLLADVAESSQIFEILRQAGYGVYTRQRVWRVGNEALQTETDEIEWRALSDRDHLAVRSLYAALVPALVQQTEAPQWDRLNGYTYWQGDTLMAYIHVTSGPRGMLIHPYIHPDLEQPRDCLIALFKNLPFLNDRTLYVTTRSYQGWLDGTMAAMGAEPGDHQALMAKRLALSSKVEMPIKLPNTGLDHVQPEVSTTSTAPTNCVESPGLEPFTQEYNM